MSDYEYAISYGRAGSFDQLNYERSKGNPWTRGHATAMLRRTLARCQEVHGGIWTGCVEPVRAMPQPPEKP